MGVFKRKNKLSRTCTAFIISCMSRASWLWFCMLACEVAFWVVSYCFNGFVTEHCLDSGHGLDSCDFLKFLGHEGDWFEAWNGQIGLLLYQVEFSEGMGSILAEKLILKSRVLWPDLTTEYLEICKVNWVSKFEWTRGKRFVVPHILDIRYVHLRDLT